MDELIIAEHALRHGLSADEIVHAWTNFVRMQYRGAPNEGEIVAVGYDKRGRFIELVALERPFGKIVYHAMRPPTVSVLKELGLVRR